MRESGVGGQFCVSAFGRNVFNCLADVFTLIHFVKKFYNVCAFNVIYKDNNAMNCIIIQHKKGSFPSALMGLGHTILVHTMFMFMFMPMV